VSAGGRHAMAAIVSIGASMGLGGCRSATDGGATPVNVVGTWTYSAIQTSPASAVLSGTLTISRQSGRDFNGTLQVTQTDGQGGSPQNLAGVVSGRALDSVTIDFDAFLSLTGRRHVGTLRGDSVFGDWIESPGLAQQQGTFAGRRAP
jgi:hypothetical protein